MATFIATVAAGLEARKRIRVDGPGRQRIGGGQREEAVIAQPASTVDTTIWETLKIASARPMAT